MKNSAGTLAALRDVWNDYASHSISPGGSCCRGCRLARQIPNLLDDAAELRAENERLSTERDALSMENEALTELLEFAEQYARDLQDGGAADEDDGRTDPSHAAEWDAVDADRTAVAW